MNEYTFEEIEHGTAGLQSYVHYTFQLTLREAASGVPDFPHVDAPVIAEPEPREPLSQHPAEQRFVVLDGQLRLLDPGSPPHARLMSPDALILKAGA